MSDRIARSSSRRSIVSAVLAALLLPVLVAPALALAPRRDPARFDDKVVRRAGGVVAVRSLRPADLDPADPLRLGWDAFRSARGGGWEVVLDDRSELPSLVVGRGIPWVPGNGNDLAGDGTEPDLERLEALARSFLGEHAALLGRWDGQLVLDPAASGRLGPHGWQVVFRQEVDGVRVEGARYDFQVTHGNLVAFGTTGWAPVRVPAEPELTADEARGRLLQHLDRPEAARLVDLRPPALRLIRVDPRGLDGSAWDGARGRGYAHRLVWRFTLGEPGTAPTWVGEIDAGNGEVVSFFDDTRYERIEGGVYPVSNTNDAGDPSSQEQPFYPMPFADYREDGGAVQITGDFGLYECTTFGSTIETRLNGTYVRINDNCGAISETATCDNEVDLDVSGGTNCVVPAGHSAGDTHSARTNFYHLNRVKQKARFWLPSNTWLQGKLTANVNINNTCNAFWNGTVNFYRRGGGCGNTGELQGVIIHEWGHGMDQNDGGGYDNASEAYADVVAILESRESCVGRGFYETQTCSGYGDTCLTCTGIREMDWDARQAHTPATPANFTQPNCGNGGGPCGKEVHCESYVPSEAIYDLAARDLPASGLDADTSWQVAERLFYISREGSGGDIFNCTLPNSDGCGTNSWFHKMRVADDDDGDLNNGTPNGAALFAAFDRHAIACGLAGDPSNQSTSSCPTLQQPVVTTRALTNAVELSWSADPNAASYYVLRNEIGCNRSQLPVDQVAAPATTYTDDQLGNNFTAYYRVQAVGANEACQGPVSACVTGTPQPFAGTVRFGRATFGCSNAVNLRVKDANTGAPTVTVDVWSDTETTPETITLTEAAPGSDRFLGEILSTSGPPVNGDGLLSIADGDTLYAEYIDVDDGAGGSNIVQQHTATADCVFPLITDVNEQNVGTSSATIVWTTNEKSDTVLTWGETKPPTTVETGDPNTTNHEVPLSGLAECTIYYYQVESTDPAGNLALDDNGGNFFHFETLGNFGSGPQPCHAGQVSIDNAVYSCAETIGFEVVDLDLNADPLVAESIVLTVTSSTETAAEAVTAVETGPNTSVFRGSISTTLGAPAPDGLLQTADGDVLTVTYSDADDGTGVPQISFDVASADCAGPKISGLAVDTITTSRATVRWNTEETADTVLEWGDTPALGQTSSSGALTTVHARTVNQFQSCQTFYFRVRSTDIHGNTTLLDNGGQPFRLHTYLIPGVYYFEDFEGAAPGWTLGGEWEVGPPQGLGGSSGQADPTSAYNNSGVLGHDLTGLGAAPGDYENSQAQIAYSPLLDGSAWTNTKLIYYRRLTAGSGDDASLWLVTNGVSRPIFRTAGDPWSDSGFQTVGLDVGALADGAQVQLEYRQNANASGNFSGWNVDDVIFKDGSLPDYGACQDCGAAPSFSGGSSAVDNDACGASGVTVSWPAAVSWGSGDGGTYAVYRDTTPGFVPSTANLVAAGVTTLSYNDVGAPLDQPSYYQVLAENSDSCGEGPNNGGRLDDNQTQVPVQETTTQPLPGEVLPVRVDMVNDAHLRLEWDAVADATSYRIYRSESPQPGTFLLLDEVTTLSYENLNEGGNANSYYYQVRAVNACSQEGP